MKVTDIKSFIIHSIRDNWVIVQVFTDEGIYGVGDCSIEGRENAVVAAVEALREYCRILGICTEHQSPFPLFAQFVEFSTFLTFCHINSYIFHVYAIISYATDGSEQKLNRAI